MLRNVIAVERDGFDIRTLVLTFEVPNEDFPLVDAVRNAVTDFCRTQAGRSIYEYNCSSFNWADVDMYLPNEFCERHDFKKVSAELADLEVDWDEHLVNDLELEDE